VADEPLVFYYDLGSPACYFVAERIMSALPVVPEWEPVLQSSIAALAPPSDRDAIARRAVALGLQPLRWPPVVPPDSHEAMLAATYAKRIGRAVAFSLAAFRQAFAAGRDLGDPDTVLIAAAACEMHPTALLKSISLRSVADALDRATERAQRAGAESLPAIQVGDRLYVGDRGLDEAVRAFGNRR
jgi:2-hydroxychromene-2-carboxylate isomerase